MWSKIQSNETPVKVCLVMWLWASRCLFCGPASKTLPGVLGWSTCFPEVHVFSFHRCVRSLTEGWARPSCYLYVVGQTAPGVKDNNGSEVQPILAGVSLDDVWTRTGRDKPANPVSLDLLKMLSVMSPMMTLKWTFAEGFRKLKLDPDSGLKSQFYYTAENCEIIMKVTQCSTSDLIFGKFWGDSGVSFNVGRERWEHQRELNRFSAPAVSGTG